MFALNMARIKTLLYGEKNNAVLAHDNNMSEMVAGSTEGGQIDDRKCNQRILD